MTRVRIDTEKVRLFTVFAGMDATFDGIVAGYTAKRLEGWGEKVLAETRQAAVVSIENLKADRLTRLRDAVAEVKVAHSPEAAAVKPVLERILAALLTPAKLSVMSSAEMLEALPTYDDDTKAFAVAEARRRGDSVLEGMLGLPYDDPGFREFDNLVRSCESSLTLGLGSYQRNLENGFDGHKMVQISQELGA